MKKIKNILIVACVIIASLLLFSCGKSDDKKTADNPDKKEVLEIKVSYIFKENEPTHIAMKDATDAINAKLDGQVKFVLYPNGQLPVYKDGLQQVVRGADFIDVDDLSYLGDYVPEFTALAGPMLYRSYDEYEQLMHTELVENLKKKAEEKGIKILSLDYIFGFRSIITNKEIVEPADLKGMKIRVPGSKLFIDTLNAMGASAVPMSFSETISALQQNVVDGLEGSYATNYLTKTYELRKNMSLTKHFLGTAGVYISTKVWDKLTDEQKLIIQEEFDRAARDNNKNLVELDKELVKKLQAIGVVINEVNLAAFSELVAPIYKNIGVSDEFYNAMMAELEKIRNK